MNLQILIEQLKAHSPHDQHESDMRDRVITFVQSYENCADRSLAVGHLTGSAWVIDETGSHALLTHHRKLNLWVQLGGHVEGDADMLSASLREAQEESGLLAVRALAESIFDIDIHEIPARQHEPAHFHYDIRYLLQADRQAPLIVSSESKDLQWLQLEQISMLTQEESVLRMVRKTQAMFPRS